MNIVIIGTGNVAHVLALLLNNAGHTIEQVMGRTPKKATALAALVNAGGCFNFSEIKTDADLYIIALSDTGLMASVENIRVNGIVVHTAGAVSKNVLAKVSKKFGVLYPLQSLRSDRTEIPPIPFLIDGNSTETIAVLQTLAETISDHISIADDDKRIKAHIAAVIANNFTNYLFTLTSDFCKEEGIAFSLLQPLIHETVNRLAIYEPATMQTGPAVRNDKETIRKHLELLTPHPQLQKIYQALSERIVSYYTNEHFKEI